MYVVWRGVVVLWETLVRSYSRVAKHTCCVWSKAHTHVYAMKIALIWKCSSCIKIDSRGQWRSFLLSSFFSPPSRLAYLVIKLRLEIYTPSGCVSTTSFATQYVNNCSCAWNGSAPRKLLRMSWELRVESWITFRYYAVINDLAIYVSHDFFCCVIDGLVILYCFFNFLLILYYNGCIYSIFL